MEPKDFKKGDTIYNGEDQYVRLLGDPYIDGSGDLVARAIHIEGSPYSGHISETYILYGCTIVHRPVNKPVNRPSCKSKLGLSI